MMVSTKGRYALRVMVDLAEHSNGAYVPLRDVAERQEISQKYLESIMSVLSKAGLVDGQHGKGGGYRLVRDTKDYTVGSILKLTEGTLAPVECLSGDGHCGCSRAAICRTLPMWSELDRLIDGFFEKYTLADLVMQKSAEEYVI